MANLHLVTGYAGEAHITAEDQAAFNSAIIGKSEYVLDKGNKLAATIISNNQIRIADGDICMQGRHIRLNENSYVDLTIENGTQGYQRYDLIAARYTKNTTTGIEECNLVVIKGESATSDPVWPEYTKGDLLEEHATQNDMILYRVTLDGLNISDVTSFFTVYDNTHGMNEILNDFSKVIIQSKNSAVAEAKTYADSKIVCGTEDVADGDESTYPDGTLYVVIE